MTAPGFSLLETLRLENGRLARRDGHLARMAASAAALGFPWDPMRAAEALAGVETARPSGRWRVRFLWSHEGMPTVECAPFPAVLGRPWRIGFAPEPVSRSPLLRFKTTERSVYDEARRARPDLDDVLLWTSHAEVTESTIANLVVDLDGARCAPPLSGPLLPGVFLADLVASGAVVERPLSKADIVRAQRIWLVNSLREWMDATLESR